MFLLVPMQIKLISTNKTISVVGILCLLVLFIHWEIIAQNHPSTADVNENYLNNVHIKSLGACLLSVRLMWQN